MIHLMKDMRILQELKKSVNINDGGKNEKKRLCHAD